MKKIMLVIIPILNIYWNYYGFDRKKENVIKENDYVASATITKNNMPYEYETEERYIKNNDKNIYGILYRPKTDEKIPLIIYSHGLGGSHSYGIEYAKELAQYGYAVYTFDFCGGSSRK